MDKISIVVTTYKFEDTLMRCLDSISNQEYENYELIVVDSSNDSCIRKIVEQYPKAKYIKSKNYERSAKRNEGAELAEGKYLAIIDSDMILDKTVISESYQRFSGDESLRMLCIPERSSGHGFWSRCKSLERSLYDKIIWMQAARVFKRETFIEFNGYDPENIGSEDYELPRRVEYKYGTKCLSIIESKVTQQEGKITLLGQLRKKMYYSKSFVKYSQGIETKESFKLQSSLAYRYWIFFKHSNKARENFPLWAGAILLKTLEFTAGGLGYIYYKSMSYVTKK
ncbi:glycosyltransferase family A protein [Polynucleobacter sp. MWH-UH35A]|uniref:glycosyltransferase family 2 protein n=1 Tax=Polynucleobacter sp. MWH-UH35A TaxID=1855619 RepID=UPI001BFEB165|nr:glycosyltransferase family A protein [Polynucleobacter sp. MWH-UH35A]QWD60443.1 glycosyltransferase family 2 protein [Polynucleobacter sp. MWH-UH35A]